KKQREEDAERDKVLHDLGFKILHIQNEDIHSSLECVLERILAYLSPNPFPSGKGLGDRSERIKFQKYSHD
ncbi:MAG: endonuclease domain-containing protein, partial [Anaerolineaceae bacterium]|nr:endonuclease domain-containing protein [Anaerolineaceae bacterium]